MQVLVGAHALLANGGVMAAVGSHLVAMAAKHHAIPFVVLAGLHKLSPLFPHDPSVTFNDFKVCQTLLRNSILISQSSHAHAQALGLLWDKQTCVHWNSTRPRPIM